MAFTFDQVFAADPSNPSNVAQNAAITIFAVGDGTMTPLTITDPDGAPLANPIITNANGFGSAFAHATLDRVAWAGGSFTGFFTSYEGMKQVALDAQVAAEAAAATAGAEAAAVADAAIGDATAEAEAAAASAATAASNASASATAAANSAALVGAPADAAIAAAVNGTGATKTALNATIANYAGVSIEEFGCKGNDPTFDNKVALDAAFAAGVPLIVPAKSYRIATKISRDFIGTRITGLPGARFYSDNLTEFWQLGTTSDARFTGITFETTVTGAGEGGSMIYSYHSVKNLLFKDCKFRAANAGANAFKIVVDNLAVEYGVENVYARNCEFTEVGRMGFEVQDHTVAPTYTKVRNVGVTDSIFKDCGKVLWGIDLSYSGPIVSATSERNRFIGSLVISCEFARAHISPVANDNEFVGLADAAMTLSFTNSVNDTLVTNAVIERNRSIGRSGSGARFWNLTDARMSNNTFLIKTAVHFRDCQRTVSQGDTYDSTGSYALWAEHNVAAKQCSYNVWKNANLVTTSAGAFSCARFQGTNAIRNRIESSRLSRVGGTRIDQTAGATINQIIGCVRDANPYQPTRTHALTDADKTLGLEDIDSEALVFTGTLTAQRAVIFPASSRGWRIRNGTTQPLNVHAGGGGTIIAAGASIYYALDGANPSFV